MLTHHLQDLRTDHSGFIELLHLCEQLDHALKQRQQLVLDLSTTKWIEGNLCACLGALLTFYYQQGVMLGLEEPRNRFVKQLLLRNGFLALFGEQKQRDSQETTIAFKQHSVSSTNGFQRYITQSFSVGSRGLPQMTPLLLKHFRRSLFEIFLNACEHADTSFDVFSCGQFFPKKQRLDFCITDLGIGFRENIRRRLGRDLQPLAAIEWAVSASNTSRRNRTGGLGLKLIREFIQQNHGRIVIVSDAAYWQYHADSVITKELPNAFPGTAVIIEINTADTQQHDLPTSLHPDEIF